MLSILLSGEALIGLRLVKDTGYKNCHHSDVRASSHSHPRHFYACAHGIQVDEHLQSDGSFARV